MAEDTNSDNKDGPSQSSDSGSSDLLLEDLVNNYGNEFSNLSDTLAEVDAALEMLESQSDALYDEAKLMLDDVKRDKQSVEKGDNSENAKAS